MNVSLDITKNFIAAVNHADVFDLASKLMNPVIFFENPIQSKENFCFELMNFGLNISKEMEKKFEAESPCFDDNINSECPDYVCKSIFIFGKAGFKVTNVKGLCMQLASPDRVISERMIIPKVIQGERLYYEQPCILKKGDRLFECGGKSAFSNHYTLLKIIGDKNSQATVTFSSADYLIMDLFDEAGEFIYAKKQTPYNYENGIPRPDILNNCTGKIPKLFDFDFRSKYIGFGNDHFASRVVIRDEE